MGESKASKSIAEIAASVGLKKHPERLAARLAVKVQGSIGAAPRYLDKAEQAIWWEYD